MAGIGRIISWPRGLRSAAWAIFFSLAVVGCGRTFDYTGQWSGKRDIPLKPGDNEVILNTIAKVELTMHPNGRFDLLEGGIPKDGTYRTDGMKAHLKVERFMQRPIEEQGETAVKMNQEILLEAQSDGSLVFTDPAGFQQESVRLIRKSEAAQPAR
jgi:hypothetical protein